MSDAGDGLIGLLMLGGMFLFGKKMGEKRTIQHYEDKSRDDQIKILQQEIDRLKQQESKKIS